MPTITDRTLQDFPLYLKGYEGSLATTAVVGIPGPSVHVQWDGLEGNRHEHVVLSSHSGCRYCKHNFAFIRLLELKKTKL